MNDVIQLGFGVTVTRENKARLDAGFKFFRETESVVRNALTKLTVKRLKEMCGEVGIPRARLRGLSTKADFIGELVAKHQDNCLKASGYVAQGYPTGAHLPSFPTVAEVLTRK